MVGGYLIDAYGFRVTFLITATMQAMIHHPFCPGKLSLARAVHAGLG